MDNVDSDLVGFIGSVLPNSTANELLLEALQSLGVETPEMEKEGLKTIANAFLEHDDFTLDIISVIALSDPSHTLNVSIISPTFTDLHLHYAARKDGVSASVSTPSTGLLGFQLYGNVPSELNARLCVFAVSKAYTAASNHSPDLSQLSILYRNLIVQYQKAIHSLLNAAVKLLRETQITLPGMDAATVPEICQKLRMNIAMVMEQTMKAINEKLDAYLNYIGDTIGAIHFYLPHGEVITAEQVCNYTLKIAVGHTVNFIKHLDNLDIVLEKLSHTLQKAVEKAQEFVDSIQSDIIDTAIVFINIYYTNIITLMKNWIEKIDAMLTIAELNANEEFVLELIYG